MPAKGTTTAVEIFGSVYYVRGDNDSDSLRELAGIVDRQMRQIAEQVATVDTAKIAILTALNLADELSQCQKLQEGERVEIREKVEALAGELDRALKS
ncbi:MAG: cell division protein ZapA [Acidobacteriota bacterium]|nr:cell division protein ZapA [Acidobacteriota bacterium]